MWCARRWSGGVRGVFRFRRGTARRRLPGRRCCGGTIRGGHRRFMCWRWRSGFSRVYLGAHYPSRRDDRRPGRDGAGGDLARGAWPDRRGGWRRSFMPVLRAIRWLRPVGGTRRLGLLAGAGRGIGCARFPHRHERQKTFVHGGKRRVAEHPGGVAPALRQFFARGDQHRVPPFPLGEGTRLEPQLPRRQPGNLPQPARQRRRCARARRRRPSACAAWRAICRRQGGSFVATRTPGEHHHFITRGDVARSFCGASRQTRAAALRPPVRAFLGGCRRPRRVMPT